MMNRLRVALDRTSAVALRNCSICSCSCSGSTIPPSAQVSRQRPPVRSRCFLAARRVQAEIRVVLAGLSQTTRQFFSVRWSLCHSSRECFSSSPSHSRILILSPYPDLCLKPCSGTVSELQCRRGILYSTSSRPHCRHSASHHHPPV